MECGACQINCPVEAIVVDGGTGCATLLIYTAIMGKEPDYGCGPGCC